jgi:hypothetical protein
MYLPVEGALKLRRRSPWEAADAGLLLWRENVVYFLPFFAMPFWICAFGLRLLPESIRPYTWFVIWLLKPLFDRLILQVAAARFFDRAAGAARICRNLGRNLLRGLAGDLLWRRFSPLRAAMLPVRMLENTDRRGIGERRRTLQRGGLQFCALLTVWGLLLEAALLGGELAFFAMTMEMLQPGYLTSLNTLVNANTIAIFSACCCNFMLIEPLYVCMGFGVYLNSRVDVEGWDIEIMFRGFAEKNKQKPVIPVMLLCALLGMAAPGNGFAVTDESGVTAADAVPLDALRTVLDLPDFGGERDTWGIRWKNQRAGTTPEINIAPWVEQIRQAFAFALRLALLALIAAAAVFLVIFLRRLKRGGTAPKDSRNTHIMAETEAESPDALLKKSRAFAAGGDIRRAWGCCLAAAIRSWAVYRGLVFPLNATEYDCRDLVNADTMSHTEERRAFAALVGHWVHLAYGGRLPPDGSFAEALAFCESLRTENAHG